ncbi:MAG: hypothetical protein JXE06_02815 [Coriobacteriia bacterium]|nr:hypothetical protein [Coriobacteriia bacterium]
MRIRFITDATLTLGTSSGPVALSHQRGEVVELDDAIAQLFITGGSALREAKPERAVKPRGERAVRAKDKE